MYLRLIPFTSLLGFIFLLLPTPIHSEYASVPPRIKEQMVVTYVVTSTQDSGPGTFRQAILDLNVGPEPSSIAFDIPDTDQNFVGYQNDNIAGTFDPDLPIVPVNGGHDPDGPLWWRIKAASDLPTITKDGTLVDGSSQRFNFGNTNPLGPEIEIVRIAGGNFNVGIHFDSNENLVKEIIINNFYPFNLLFQGNNNQLRGCYIGIEPSGSGSTAHTITTTDNLSIWGDGNIVGGLAEMDKNLISGRAQSGIFIQGSENQIVGNYVGVNRQATEIVGGALNAILIWGGGDNIIAHNVIGGGAITLEFPGVHRTYIHHNAIGTDPSGLLNLAGKTDFGAVYVVGSSSNNIIGPENLIKNHKRGIVIHGSDAPNNQITQNAISNNEFEGIQLLNGGNNDIPSPTINFIGAGSVTGSAPPHATIEIFSDPDDEGLVYEGMTQADSQGNFTWYGFPQGPHVTATATNTEGNTSEFSAPIPAFSTWIPIILN